MGTAIKHPVPDLVKQPFVVFLTSGHSDAQGWELECPDVKNYNDSGKTVPDTTVVCIDGLCKHNFIIALPGSTIVKPSQKGVVKNWIQSCCKVVTDIFVYTTCRNSMTPSMPIPIGAPLPLPPNLGKPKFKRKTATNCITKCTTVWVKKSPYGFLNFFPKRLGISNQFFTYLLYDHFYTRVQIFIQIYPPLTKLCHTKRDHLAKFYISLEPLTSMFVYSANDVIGDVMPYRTCLLTL